MPREMLIQVLAWLLVIHFQLDMRKKRIFQNILHSNDTFYSIKLKLFTSIFPNASNERWGHNFIEYKHCSYFDNFFRRGKKVSSIYLTSISNCKYQLAFHLLWSHFMLITHFKILKYLQYEVINNNCKMNKMSFITAIQLSLCILYFSIKKKSRNCISIPGSILFCYVLDKADHQ